MASCVWQKHAGRPDETKDAKLCVILGPRFTVTASASEVLLQVDAATVGSIKKASYPCNRMHLCAMGWVLIIVRSCSRLHMIKMIKSTHRTRTLNTMNTMVVNRTR